MPARASIGHVITFYSYKGGTGRSMALANLAWILACCGRRVLVIDWDLEAPGLHRYFRPFLIDSELTSSEGLIDMVDAYATQAIRPVEPGKAPDPEWYLDYADFSDYLLSINFDHFGEGGKIDFLPAGRQGEAYALTVSSFNWQNFYDRLGGGGFFEAFKAQARRQYDYILIDSRTGVSDTAGICSVQMPDTLVVCFTYNNQSITGAAAVAESARKKRTKLAEERLERPRNESDQRPGLVADSERPYRIFPVPMRVDSGESDRLALRQAFARASFASMLWHLRPSEVAEYWSSVEVPHKVFYAYEEVLAPFKDDALDPKTVLAAFVRLTRFVTDRDVSELVFPVSPAVKAQFLEAFARTPADGETTKRAAPAASVETEVEALARRAEAVLVRLDDAMKVDARRALLRLVRLGRVEEGGGYFPIRANLDDFDEAQRQALGAFSDAHLVSIVTDGDRSADAPARQPPARTVGLADERLLKAWKTLVGWIEGDREFLLWRQQLRGYLGAWDRHARDPGALLSVSLLNEAVAWQSRRSSDLNTAEREFLDASAIALTTPDLRRPAGVAANAVRAMEPPAAQAGSSTTSSVMAAQSRLSAGDVAQTASGAVRMAGRRGFVVGGLAAVLIAVLIVLFGRSSQQPKHADVGVGVSLVTDAAPSDADANRDQVIAKATKDGEQALKDGDALRALLSFNKAVLAGDKTAAIQLALGRTYDALGRGSDAEAAYAQAMALTPRDPDVFFARGESRGLRLDFGPAMEDLDHAIQLDGKNAKYFRARAALLEKRGKATEALAEYSRAIELQPQESDAYLERGNLLEKTDPAKAAADYRSVLALPGGDPNLKLVAQVKLEQLNMGDESPARGDQRVFLQYNESDRGRVREIAEALTRALKPISLSAPELVSAPSLGAVRYFFTTDAPLARRVKTIAEEVLAQRGFKVVLSLQYLGRIANVRKQTVELWLPALDPMRINTANSYKRQSMILREGD